MTSFITTGHLRGGHKSKNFQPRSFNMGISKDAFNIDGFGKKIVENFWKLNLIKFPQDIFIRFP